jgi:hypothetical protein
MISRLFSLTGLLHKTLHTMSDLTTKSFPAAFKSIRAGGTGTDSGLGKEKDSVPLWFITETSLVQESFFVGCTTGAFGKASALSCAEGEAAHKD